MKIIRRRKQPKGATAPFGFYIFMWKYIVTLVYGETKTRAEAGSEDGAKSIMIDADKSMKELGYVRHGYTKFRNSQKHEVYYELNYSKI